MAFTFRLASVDDAEEVARSAVEGFETYREFAPAGWTPPSLQSETETVRARLEDPDTWCLLAESGDGVAGHVGFLPSARARRPGTDRGLAHLWQLFVRRPFWGTGLAVRLLHAAVEEAADRGFATMRLFTPAGQARARRFYEREGWTLAQEPFADADFGLPLVEYRRPLTPPVAAPRSAPGRP